ncbi:MAG: LAGLIDADG family homing endonuclease [Acidimicrobiales bacterium]
MLGTPSIRRYSFAVTPFGDNVAVSSENPTGADNQQERLDAYLAGFVDGEGTFHVAVWRNPSTRLRWQLVTEFHVSQSPDRQEVLDLLQVRLGCGRIRENHRGSRDTTLVFVVRNRTDLVERVIPFFDSQPLLSSKQREYLTFRSIVMAMVRGEHLTAEGFEALKAQALSMNGEGRYRTVHRRETPESSEAICRTPAAQPVKIWSDLHGDMQSQAEQK